MDILISAPSYTHGCGGIRVLHYFGWLAKFLGHNVRVESPYCNPEWGNYSGRIGKPDIKIVPEIDPVSNVSDGNVIRWVLHFPGVLGNGPKVYPSHELVVSYHEIYDDSAEVAATRKPILKFGLPFCEMPTTSSKSTGIASERNLEGVKWYGKANRSTTPLLSVPEITRTWPNTRLGLMELLERTVTAYSFDKYTVFNDEALLCGCKVLLWDGNCYQEYKNDNAANKIMDIKRDTESVRVFLSSAVEIFGIRVNDDKPT